MKCEIEGKVAIVTGAANGLGCNIASSLASEGICVAIADIDFPKLKSVCHEIENAGGKCLALLIDVSKDSCLDELVHETIRRFSRIDILVNNAGICPRKDFEQITEQQWDSVMATNLKSVFLLSQKVLKYMRQNGYGRIINIASAAGKLGGIQVGADYAASKAGVICLTKSLANLYAQYGINVNAVCPGVVNTEMTHSISLEKIKKYESLIPIGEIGKVEDIANAVIFLLSNRADYITGEIMDVNGGFLMD